MTDPYKIGEHYQQVNTRERRNPYVVGSWAAALWDLRYGVAALAIELGHIARHEVRWLCHQIRGH